MTATLTVGHRLRSTPTNGHKFRPRAHELYLEYIPISQLVHTGALKFRWLAVPMLLGSSYVIYRNSNVHPTAIFMLSGKKLHSGAIFDTDQPIWEWEIEHGGRMT